MLTQRMQDALNDQIQCEFYSAYAYLAMSAHFEMASLPGCMHWMKMQAQEEMQHAMRLYQYILDRGGAVVLQPIEQPPSEFGAPVEVFRAGLAHERTVTERINNLYALAVEEKDYATESHLKWFVDEQVEEEKTATEVIDLFARAGDHEAALLLLDARLSERSAEE